MENLEIDGCDAIELKSPEGSHQHLLLGPITVAPLQAGGFQKVIKVMKKLGFNIWYCEENGTVVENGEVGTCRQPPGQT